VKRVTEVINIPLTVGGGIKDLGDIEVLLEAGASKTSINTAAVKNPHFIKEASQKFGKKSMIIAIDGKKSSKTKSGFEVYIEGGRKATGIDVCEWAKRTEELGAGELLVTSINADGTKQGYDLEFTKKIVESVKIPVIASGGAGKLEDIWLVLTEGRADAALAASIFHFQLYTVRDVKEYLKRKGLEVRV
ncbi:MAG: imidazole glycerol phosphate synthase subunit HisF, partial [Candidatus Omnitrophica bacterium]|nr:imidazole glycerol phosphate synthase subunit HisF [Candidatus Omnitrophota bacterium]